jgi:hypothetical protein
MGQRAHDIRKYLLRGQLVAIRRIWERTLDRIAPLKPGDLSRLDLLDGLRDLPTEP